MIDGKHIPHAGPMTGRELQALAALSLSHPKPVPMLEILRESEPVKDALYLGLEFLRCRGWVRVRRLCWSLTARGLNEAPNHPDLVAARRAMN